MTATSNAAIKSVRLKESGQAIEFALDMQLSELCGAGASSHVSQPLMLERAYQRWGLLTGRWANRYRCPDACDGSIESA